jgi:hypothetical protein
LVGTEHESTWHAPSNGPSLFSSEQSSYPVGLGRVFPGLDRPLVEVGRTDVDRNSRGLEKASSDGAPGSYDKRMGSEPQRHNGASGR